MKPTYSVGRSTERHALRLESLEPRTMLAGDLLVDFGGTSTDEAWDVEVDAAGNVYVTGRFSETVDFDPDHSHVADVDILTSQGSTDIFAAKYDPTGQLIWIRQMGGVSGDSGFSIDVNANGDVFVAGQYSSATADFDLANAYGNDRDRLMNSGPEDGFIAKLDSNGGFQWVQQIEGDGEVAALVTADSLGNAYAHGITKSALTNFETLSIAGAGARDGFIAKLDPSGSFVWAQPVASSGEDSTLAIAVDETDTDPQNWVIYVAGSFSENADVAGQLMSTNGGADALVLALQANGQFSSMVSAGGIGDDVARGIGIDALGNIVTAGVFENVVDFDPAEMASAVLTSAGAGDVFAWKLDQNLSYMGATRMGGIGDDSTASVDSVSVGPNGTTYVTGRFSLLATFGDVVLRSHGDGDGFVAALDGDLNVNWAHRFGGGSNGEQDGSIDEGLGITADQNGHLYTTGRFRETADFADGDVATSVGSDDAFLWKFDVQTTQIRGTVFADLNGDGVNNDDGEGITDGWTVYLDANDNGQLDAGETFTTTSGNTGYFDFGVQPAGTYTIRQQLPSGWTQSLPANDAAHVLTLAGDDGPVHVTFANHVATELTIHQSPDVPKRLKGRGGNSVTSTLSVGESAKVFDINVIVDLTYDGTQGLEIFLNAPNGTRVELFSSAGGAGNDLAGTVFDDEATTFFRDALPPFAGTLRPEYALVAFDGLDSQGEWTLEINDRLGWNNGRLNSWSLEILSPLPLPPAPTFSIDDVDVTEGGSGTVTATFTVTRSGDPGQQVFVDYATADDTALAGSDYVAIPLTTLTFAPGVTSLPVGVSINADANPEDDETFFVNLSNPVGGGIADGQGIGTILDDDSPIVASSMFVYDIRFDSKRGSKDHRAVFEIRTDSNGDGQGTSNDNPIAGVEITVDFAGMTFIGTTDSNGVFRTPWIKNTPAGTQYANAVDLALADYVWDQLLDLEDDSDGDGNPDDMLTL